MNLTITNFIICLLTLNTALTMNLDEFETQYRNTLDESLNQLQSAVLLMAQLEVRINSVSQSLHQLTQTVEEFVTQQRAE